MEKSEAAQPIHTVLNGPNYLLWAEEISSFLKGRKLWKFVSGTMKEPVQLEKEPVEKYGERLEDWECKNHQILTWFRNTIAPSIKVQFGRIQTAKELWDLLQKRYGVSDKAHRYKLLADLEELLSEETRLGTLRPKVNDDTALAASYPTQSRQNGRYCNHCMKSGHTMNNCFRLHPKGGKPFGSQYSTHDTTIKPFVHDGVSSSISLTDLKAMIKEAMRDSSATSTPNHAFAATASTDMSDAWDKP